MTNKEAIDILTSIRDYLCRGNPIWRTEPIHDAVNMAVDALRKTENSSEKPNNCEDEDIFEYCPRCGMRILVDKPKDEPQIFICPIQDNYEALIEYEPQTERIKTLDYCDICNHKGCDNCTANSLDDYCVPSGYTPKDTPQIDEFKNFDREDLILLIECQKERIGELLADKDTPQTDCNGCKFVGWYDTEFPCVNCIRKNKDYYTSEQTDCPWK